MVSELPVSLTETELSSIMMNRSLSFRDADLEQSISWHRKLMIGAKAKLPSLFRDIPDRESNIKSNVKIKVFIFLGF